MAKMIVLCNARNGRVIFNDYYFDWIASLAKFAQAGDRTVMFDADQS